MKDQEKKPAVFGKTNAILSSACAALWLTRIFIWGEYDGLTVAAGAVWVLAAAVHWLRFWKGKQS